MFNTNLQTKLTAAVGAILVSLTFVSAAVGPVRTDALAPSANGAGSVLSA